ncbi:MAG TPA: response regulator transcription factor [Gaiellaceae bacterium]|nr:response regulator transcription factor [Gaiellaceae bacterium]
MSGGSGKAQTVLVADDAAIVRKVVGEMLADAGYEVIAEAADGLEAVALYEEHRPEVVVIDVNMPRLDGIDAAIRIRRTYPTARIVVATVYVTEKRLRRMTKIGGVDVLLKPFESRKLVEAIERTAPHDTPHAAAA